MKSRRISLSKETLARMPADERNFFLLAGHIQNEINSLSKVFAWCLTAEPSRKLAEVEGLANGLQAQFYARLLAGKLCEARKVLDKAYFAKSIHLSVDPKLHPDAKASLKKIKSYFNHSNSIINAVRNTFSFHYDVDAFASHWCEALDQSDFELVLGGTVGNNLSLGSELVLNNAVLKSINSDSGSSALQKLLNDVQSLAAEFTIFLEGVMIVIVESATGSSLSGQGSQEEIWPSHLFGDVKIPYFYDHGLRE